MRVFLFFVGFFVVFGVVSGGCGKKKSFYPPHITPSTNNFFNANRGSRELSPVLTAISAVETKGGRVLGKAGDGLLPAKRGIKQILSFLVLAKHLGWDVSSVPASDAGALGEFQILPCTLLWLAGREVEIDEGWGGADGVRAVQGFLEVRVDGDAGPKTRAALVRFLESKGFSRKFLRNKKTSVLLRGVKGILIHSSGAYSILSVPDLLSPFLPKEGRFRLDPFCETVGPAAASAYLEYALRKAPPNLLEYERARFAVRAYNAGVGGAKKGRAEPYLKKVLQEMMKNIKK